MTHLFGRRQNAKNGSSSRCVASLHAAQNGLESLEPRTLMTAPSWSAAEVYLEELINRARSNPQAEAQRLGINLAQGLSAGDASVIGVKEPLALNALLTQSARNHAQDMAVRNFFDHVNPDFQSPSQRAQALGYLGTAGENIGAQYDTIDALYTAWMANPTQRTNILSLYQFFDATYHYDHLGVGVAAGVSGSAYSSYYVADFGNPSSAARKTTLLGVVFNDTDANNFYGIGEGMTGVRIDVAAVANPTTVIATYTTDAAGNYQIDLPTGSYTVKYTLVGTARTYSQSIAIGTQNVRVAVKDVQLVAPPPPDDHADAGQWTSAAAITVDSTTGNGVAFGNVEVSGDTDLFKFVAAKSGLTTISTISAGSPFAATGQLFNAAGSPLATGANDGLNSVVTFNLVAGQTYFVLAQARDGTSTGHYTVLITGPTDSGGGNTGGGSTGSTVGSGQAISSGFASNGASTMAYIDSNGRPIFAQRADDGTWASTDLFAAAGGPTLRGQLSTYVDPKNGLTYIAGISDTGLILYKRAANNTWTMRNISSEVVGARRIVSALTILVDADRRIQIIARTADGSIADYWQNGASIAPGDFRFRHTNIGVADLRPRGLTLPALSGDLSGWITSSDDLQLAGLDASGHVLLFTRRRASGAYQPWTFIDLTPRTGAPALSGSLFGVFSAGRATISGVDGDGNLWFLDQKLNGAWRSRDITDAIGGPKLSASGVTGYINKLGAAFAIGLSNTGQVVTYRSIYKDALLTARWSAANVSLSLPDAPMLSGQLGAAFKWIGGTASVSAITTDGLAVRFIFSPVDGWTYESVYDKLGV